MGVCVAAGDPAVTVWRGVVFRDYDASSMDHFEVCVADGCVTPNFDTLPPDLTAYQARIVANMLVAAANEIDPPAGFGG